jgi:hypothetical protein
MRTVSVMGRTSGLLAAVLLTAGLVGACSTGDGVVHPTEVVTECEAAFSVLDAALAGDQDLDEETSWEQTLEACSSPEQWIRTAQRHQDAVAGRDPVEELSERCAARGDASGLAACRLAEASPTP